MNVNESSLPKHSNGKSNKVEESHFRGGQQRNHELSRNEVEIDVKPRSEFVNLLELC